MTTGIKKMLYSFTNITEIYSRDITDRKYIEQPLRPPPLIVTTRTPIITNSYSSSKEESSSFSKSADGTKISSSKFSSEQVRASILL